MTELPIARITVAAILLIHFDKYHDGMIAGVGVAAIIAMTFIAAVWEKSIR